MYAYFKKLDYFSTECIYSPDAYRGHARAFLKDLEAARPSAIIDIIHSGEAFELKDEVKATQKVQRRPSDSHIQHLLMIVTETCQRCGYMSSNALCKACHLLEGLERGMADAGLVRIHTLLCKSSTISTPYQTDKARKKLDAEGPAPQNIRTIPFFTAPSLASTSEGQKPNKEGEPRIGIDVEVPG